MSKFRLSVLFAVIAVLITSSLITSCANTNERPFKTNFDNPPERHIVIGNVVDAKTGEPLVGCPVLVEGTTFGALTDVYGTYAIYDVPNGAWSVSAKMVGYKTKTDSVVTGKTPAIANFELEESEIKLEPVQIRYAISCGPNGCTVWTPATDSTPAQSHPLGNCNPIKLDKIFPEKLNPTGIITGKVTDTKTKEPLIGIPVQIDSLALGAFTDIDGIYTIKEVPRGTHDLSAKAVGYQFQIKKIAVDEKPAIVDFELEETEVEIWCGLAILDTRDSVKTGTITGRVVDKTTKEPIIGARVEVSSTLGDLTDIDGTYTIENVPYDTCSLLFSSVGFSLLIKEIAVDSPSITVNVELDESEIEIACWLVVRDTRKFGTITGKVYSWQTGKPIAGMIVQVDDTDLKTTTDSTGFYSFKSVPCGFRKVSLLTYAGKENTQDVVVSSKPAIVNFKYLRLGS